MRMILVDDSQTNLVILTSLCRKIPGIEAMGFADSALAIDYLMSHDVDLIVVDYSMPKITGTELIKRLRASDRHAKTPIIMVTSSTERPVRQRALELGATAFLNKPVVATEFIALVRELTDVNGPSDRSEAPADASGISAGAEFI